MIFFTPDQLAREMFDDKAFCHFEIMKSEVQDNCFKRLDDFMAKTHEYIPASRQKVWFSFSGYDTDKRELIYIPEVVSYAKAFLIRHPYFWYYATPFNSEFFFLVLLLDEANNETINNPTDQKIYIKTDNNMVVNLIQTIGMNLNNFGKQTGDIEGSVESFKVWSANVFGALEI